MVSKGLTGVFGASFRGAANAANYDVQLHIGESRATTSALPRPPLRWSRHCEPTGRANARPVTGFAKQSMPPLAEARIASSLPLLGMTAKDTPPHPRGAMPELCPTFSLDSRGRRECRVRAAPAVSCAKMHEKAHTSIQVQTEHSGIPCTMVLRLIPCSPRRRIPFVTVIGELAVVRDPVGFAKPPPT
jgi:hypothetical protein